MKKKQEQEIPDEEDHHHHHHDHELEILKAVAQAWHGHSSSHRSTISEFDARRMNFKGKPSRFKLEAMRMMSKACISSESFGKRWDFEQSLWDSYEIVTITKKLEAGLVLENNSLSEFEIPTLVGRRRKLESKNSLRSLFNRMSSRRFKESDFPDAE